jgi:hypothetical protein
MRVYLKKIIDSPLLAVEKIDAMKTFLLSPLDFMLKQADLQSRNTDCGLA